MVEELDSSVGAVIDKLKELELEQNTFVFFCSDNGATRLGSNGTLRGHKGSVWEGGHRVPAIAWWPGKIAPSSSNATAISMDLLPTLLATANVPLPNEIKIDGTDLSPVLFGTGRLPLRTLCWSTGRGLALRRDNWKLVKSGEKAQLFNLADDLSEATDLSQEHPDKLSDLMTRARTWKIDVQKVSGESPSEATQHFDTVVAPALATNCLGCHNSTERKGGLDLSSHQTMVRGGESGKVVTPGNFSDSLLWQRIADAEMPPDEPLSRKRQEYHSQMDRSGRFLGHRPH